MENYLYQLIMLTVIYKAAHGLPVGFIIFTIRHKINRGDCIHVYAFHADTLKKYTWEEIRTGKKYWFRETVCQSTDIQFPDGFKYMEESDAENP